jgi:hypothetical protein
MIGGRLHGEPGSALCRREWSTIPVGSGGRLSTVTGQWPEISRGDAGRRIPPGRGGERGASMPLVKEGEDSPEFVVGILLTLWIIGMILTSAFCATPPPQG